MSPRWLILAFLVSSAPDTPGVLELWDDEELVYVRGTRGETETLRSVLIHEVLEHRRQATHFSWEITFDPQSRERELLAEFESQNRHPPRLNSSG
jgi:hypothetical protein